jgi:type IV secretory pathway VirD2 relaxase
MAQDDFDPKLGRIRDSRSSRTQRHAALVFRRAGKRGARAVLQRGHITSGSLTRGMGTGLRAAAGLIASGSRRVIVKARYTRILNGDLGAAQAHMKYIVRDGVTREGAPGRLYDANGDDVDGSAFLARSADDPHQFRFIVSADEGAQLSDLKPFIRDLLTQMERDLDTKLDWVAVDHFNTGHPHTHVVLRGKDDQGKDLVMARDYIAHGVRARAQSLLTLELGPETQIERMQKLFNEVGQERLTRLDRALIGRSKDNILVVTAAEELDPTQHALRVGRLKTLERLGLAEERQQGVWELDSQMEGKLRQLGQRADKFKMMQRALQEAGIERSAATMALFERGPRKTPLVGKVVGVGLVDEISDHTWVVIDAMDGRAHYAELGRLKPADVPVHGTIVALAGDSLDGKPSPVPKLQVLSPVALEKQATYDGPTWLDEGILSRWQPETGTSGFAGQVRAALATRRDWLVERRVAKIASGGELLLAPDMMRTLRKAETDRIVQQVSRELKAAYVSSEPGARITGVYERAIATPTGKLAVLRREDTFTLAPWRPALEPFRGRSVSGLVGPNRVTWGLNRGRGLPGRT